MKKKVVALLLVAVMAAGVFTGCGKSAQGEGDTQAAMANVESSQDEGTDVPVDGAETTGQQADTNSKPVVASNASAAIEAGQGDAEQARATSEPETARTDTQGAGEAKETTEATTATTTAQSQAATATTTQTTTQTSGTSKEFIDLLNAKRSEMGLNPIEWDESLAEEAMVRAQAIVSDYSHNGRSTYSENIYSCFSGNINDWFEAWWNSEGHRLNMMEDGIGTGACAFTVVDGQYYVVFVAEDDNPVMSAEEWNEYKETAVEEGTLQIIDQQEATEEETGYTVYGTEGVEICTDEEVLANIEELRAQLGL